MWAENILGQRRKRVGFLWNVMATVFVLLYLLSPTHVLFISHIISPSYLSSHMIILYCLSLFFCLSLSLQRTFSPSCWLSPSLMLHYLLCGNAQNCLPLLIIRCIRQGHGLVSGSDSPSACWESGREETWRGGAGGKDKGGGSLCPIVSALCVSV